MSGKICSPSEVLPWDQAGYGQVVYIKPNQNVQPDFFLSQKTPPGGGGEWFRAEPPLGGGSGLEARVGVLARSAEGFFFGRIPQTANFWGFPRGL